MLLFNLSEFIEIKFEQFIDINIVCLDIVKIVVFMFYYFLMNFCFKLLIVDSFQV